MKGISTILAMILIVIIVVALIGLTYTFAVGLFTTTAQGANTQTTSITQNMQKSATIIAASCGSGTSTRTFKFTLKNTGTLTVVAGDQFVFQDGVKVTSVTFTDLTSNQVSNEYSFANVTQADAGSHELKISSPAGIFPYTVTCS